ncbi:hypothetical protein [Enterobacter cloacae]|uniref:hypothetical protein n=1 Tax=Enterobacter cloacae TaxID=550 RepID=UPI002B1F8646|nr:hypothetical protein [Enterobacter cloacae]MEA5217581.1 hypothetical protein [Enterobacter cloacae]
MSGMGLRAEEYIFNGTITQGICGVSFPTVTDLPAASEKYLFNHPEGGAARGYGIVLSTEELSSWIPVMV